MFINLHLLFVLPRGVLDVLVLLHVDIDQVVGQQHLGLGLTKVKNGHNVAGMRTHIYLLLGVDECFDVLFNRLDGGISGIPFWLLRE